MLPAPREGAAVRLDFIDVAKAIGIVLVVAGHATSGPADLLMLIYSFHMPLFFFLSGCLQREGRFDAPLLATAGRAARALLVPYLFFFALSLAYWLATRHLGQRAARFAGVGVDDALWGLATGVSSDLFVNITLWFFPCMFLCQVIYAGLRRCLGAGAALALLVGAAVLMLATTLPWARRLPWGLDIVWIALVFYASGHWLRASGRLTRGGSRTGAAAVLELGLLAAVWIGLAILQGRVDLAQANFGRYPLLFIPCAMAGVALVLAIARRVSLTNPLRWLAANSIVIFPLHPLLINVASGLSQFSGRKALADESGLGWYAIATAWGLLASVPAALLLRRHCPGLIGVARAPGARGVA